METDIRYYDLTARLEENGVDWKDLDLFLKATTLHPFSYTLETDDEEAGNLLRKYKEEVQLYDYKVKEKDKPAHFFVHIGAVETFCEYLRLPQITRHEATKENLRKFSKPYTIPPLDRDEKEYLEIREAAKNLYMKATSEKKQREADRMQMIAFVIDHDQELRKMFA